VYLLGISHIDPVREGMSLARFMHALRADLPDIDLDFPHDQRDAIFHRLFQVLSGHAASLTPY
jgi:error-prone DNA polymerase